MRIEATRGADPVETPQSDLEEKTRAEHRLVTGAGGSVSWTPLPGDQAALGGILRPAPGALLSSVSWQAPATDVGLGLRVNGRTILVLPGSYDDVQVEAQLVLEDFEGVVGLAHHVRSMRLAGLLTISLPGGEVTICWEGPGSSVWLTGEAATVFEGTVNI